MNKDIVRMHAMTHKPETLALRGGPRTIKAEDAALFHWPIVTDADEQAVLDVLRAGAMSRTEITRAFEREYAAWVGVEHALGYCNGTAPLLGAFWACGLGAGDELICPSITYWASCAAVLHLGATVNFADIDPVTLCIDPEDIEHRIGPRTKAIVVVHYAGYPCDMDPIVALARKHGVRVIEDVSHETLELGKEYVKETKIMNTTDEKRTVNAETAVRATLQPWSNTRYVFGDGSSGLPWSVADTTHIAPPLPNVEATDADHFRICIHEGWGEDDADALLATLERVERKFLRGV